MRLLYLGDIMGRGGRRVVTQKLPQFRKENKIDVCFANCENLAGGKGITKAKIDDMIQAGVDFFTSGNHIWGNKNIIEDLNDPKFPVIRPANYPDLPEIPGRGFDIITVKKKKILVINLLGRVFMAKDFDCPFRAIDMILEETKKKKVDFIFVDFHAEATSEKVAMKHYLDSRVSLLVGTHTHVPTADYQITENDMAYVTDLGMCGPNDSIIGMKKEGVIQTYLTQIPAKNEVATGSSYMQGIIVEFNKEIPISIEHICVDEDE